eukprot:6287959-Amphidinium_carterae.2
MDAGRQLEQSLPSIFFTLAPAEWKYILHEGMFQQETLTEQQWKLTMHMHNTMEALLEAHLLKNGSHLHDLGIETIRQWSVRFEFQSRGTIHLHAVLWADLIKNVKPDTLTGRTGEQHQSKMVKLLEQLFKCRVDAQCGDGSHNLLRYVAGYVAKASDALQFKSLEALSGSDESRWRQTYRLLCKKAPLEQELVMEFAGLPMVRHSFTGEAVFAPIPGSKAENSSRHAYNAYQASTSSTFVQTWMAACTAAQEGYPISR